MDEIIDIYKTRKNTALSAGFFYEMDGPFGPLGKNGVSRGANKALILRWFFL